MGPCKQVRCFWASFDRYTIPLPLRF
uniref:Uncharacterized protein n=1 Tax=Arundo donax TaxID=35708 RepID=A0A0A8ZHH8_ARUDO